MRQAGNLWEMYNQFVREQKELGVCRHEAHQRWQVSEERRQVLATMRLPELKKGRFVDKTATFNPFAVDPADVD